MPLVSVIIPTHKRPDLLRRALASVLRQTFQDFEIVVVENGQSHDGQAVVQELRTEDARLKYVYEETASLPLARNIGINSSTGTYISFLDDDDEWLPEKLERQVAVLEQDPRVGLVGCKAWMMHDNGAVHEEALRFCGELDLRVLVMKGCVIRSPSSIVWRRSCQDAVGDFDLRYAMANDYWFYLRMARHSRLAYIHKPLYRYYLHGSNMCTNATDEQKEEGVQMLEKLTPAPHLGVTKSLIAERIARHRHNMAVDARQEGRYGRAAGQYFKAVQADPLIGAKLGWGRFRNPPYQTVRPYLAFLYCGIRGCLGC